MLTQTSVQAAQVETYSNLNTFVGGSEHEHKDVYGWFVEMDEEALQDRFQAVEDASENCKAIANPDLQESLTFAAAPTEQDQVKRSVELDSEVEWAKAADTVDDVLGEIPFF